MAELVPIPLRRNGHFIETVAEPHLTIADVFGSPAQVVEEGDRIVRAVNCHAKLVQALEQVLPLARSWEQQHGTRLGPFTDRQHIKEAQTLLNQVKEEAAK